MRTLLLVSWLSVTLACGASSGGPDSAAVDLGLADAGAADTLSADGSAEADAALPDAAVADAELPDSGANEGVGIISGACGELDDAELLGPGPSAFENHLDFVMGYQMADLMRLSAGAQEILADGTAGGSSGYSEAFSFEVLHRCEGAELLKSETEVLYEPPTSKKTDILVQIDGHKIGVSVTRAVSFPRDAAYPVSQAFTLIDRKFADILESSANVVAADQWSKQILHVVAYGPDHADSIRLAAEMVDPAVRADTILWVTITDGDDAFLY